MVWVVDGNITFNCKKFWVSKLFFLMLMGHYWVHKTMLVKENPFRLNYISGRESFVTSKVRKESTEKMRWTKGDQNKIPESVL
jgi:hypothetical protein